MPCIVDWVRALLHVAPAPVMHAMPLIEEWNWG